MTIVAVDDTDSRDHGMCTTYLAARLADRLAADGATVKRRLLVRCNPAIEWKTRGNAACAVHTDADPETAADRARALVEAFAVTETDRTSPGVVVAAGAPDDVPEGVSEFATDALRRRHDLDDAVALADAAGYRHEGWCGGRGRIGALAAVGAARAFDEWTYERLTYREFERCGRPREVDRDSVFAAAAEGYPTVWDTVDRVEGEAVCVPSAPGPVLHGIRGDGPSAVERAADRIEGEPAERAATFHTNQGTDAHLRDGAVGDLRDGRAYRVEGEVRAAPETREGGHVHFDLTDGNGAVRCVAFEPTKRFRDRVRALRAGDRLTVCGEVGGGSLKLEKFAVRSLVRTELETPDCPACDRSMSSAGLEAGYRCRDCGTTAPGKVERPVERDLEPGWYEVPPVARRHVAKPLVRGGFDAPVHPER